MIDNRDVIEQIKQEIYRSRGRKEREEMYTQYYGNYNRTSYNIYICQIVIETSEEDNSE